MRIVHIRTEFETSFTLSFLYTSQVKYNVEFTNDSIADIAEYLLMLWTNLINGNQNNIHVCYDFCLPDVEHVESLLEKIVEKYRELFPMKSYQRLKIYTAIEQIREVETKTPEEIAREVLNHILTPAQPTKQTKKQRIEEAAKAKSKERILNMIRKNRAKKWE